MRSRNSSFGYGRPTFICGTCTRRTRSTGLQGNIDLCPECFELHGMQNSFWDDGEAAMSDWMVTEVAALMATIEKRGGNMARVNASLADLLAGIATYKEKTT